MIPLDRLWAIYLQPLLPWMLLAALPGAVVAALRWRRLHPSSRTATRSRHRRTAVTVVLEVALLLGVLAVLLLTLTPRDLPPAREIDLLPFNWIWRPMREDARALRAAEAVANLVMLVPVGAALAARWRALTRAPWVVLLSLTVPLALEVTQFVLGIGRQSALEDVILGAIGMTAGCLAGAAAARAVGRARRGDRREQPTASRGLERRRHAA